MKQSIQWIAALFMAASGGLALAGPGCGDCSYMLKTARIEPVRELVVRHYVVQRPMIVGERCLMNTPSRITWSEPAAEPFNTLGNVVALPFRAVGSTFAWTGRQLSGPSEMIETQPAYVGERITTVTTVKKIHHKKHHLYNKVSYRTSMLMPVGERFTTVKVIRTSPLLPVGERFTTVRVIRTRPLLEPVGERFTTIRTVRVIPSRPILMPVGERLVSTNTIVSRPVLQPIGERTIIRTTRVISNPWNSCGCSYNPYR